MSSFARSAVAARSTALRLVVVALAAALAPVPLARAADDDAAFAGVVPRAQSLEGLAAKLGSSLARALEERGVRSLVERAPVEGAAASGRVEDLTRLLSDARGRYLEGEFQGAVQQADDGIDRFEESFAFESDDEAWAAWSELMLVRALALSRLGDTKASDRTLAHLAAARPDYVPDPGLAPPKLASRHKAIRARLENARVALQVTSRPAGANVLVDGKSVGATPLELKEMLAGRHFVSVRLGAERHDEALFVKEGAKEIRAELGDPRREAAERLRSSLRAGAGEPLLIAAAASTSPETYVAVVEPGVGELPLLVGRFRGGKLEAVVAAMVKDDLANADEVAAVVAEQATSAAADAWLDGRDAGGLRARFLSAAAAGGDDGGIAPLVFVGAGVGALVLVGAATAAGLALFVASQPQNPGGTTVVIDASAL